MSGPKVDVAEIRQQELMKLEAAREGRKNLADTIQKLIEQVNKCAGLDMDLMMQDESLRFSCENVKMRQSSCVKELKNLLNMAKSGNEMLNIDGLYAQSRQIFAKFNDDIQGEIVIVGQLVQSNQKFKELEANRQQLEQAKRKKILRLTTVDDDSSTEVTEEEINELVETFSNELSDFMASTNMLSKHKNSMLLINQDLQELIQSGIPEDRKEKRIKRLFVDFQKMSSLVKDEVAEMEYMYAEYIKECFDLSAPLMQMSDFDSVKDIEEAISDAKENATTNVSKEYIKRQIDEVMAKYGYDIVRSDMLTETNQNGQILYGVDEDTAINVFVSDEKQVTMRVVGVGFDSNISEIENEKLFQQQCAFCSMHPQITAELEMRGVILHTKKHMPPDRKYNKKIQTKSTSDNQTMSRAKKERKRNQLKTMYKE